MKNIKTILIAVLSFMLLFSVSCKNEDKTGGDGGVYDNYRQKVLIQVKTMECHHQKPQYK